MNEEKRKQIEREATALYPEPFKASDFGDGYSPGHDAMAKQNQEARLKQRCHITGATTEANKALPLLEALEELVELKRIKDAEGKTDDYEKRQPLAWEAAQQAIINYKNQ